MHAFSQNEAVVETHLHEFTEQENIEEDICADDNKGTPLINAISKQAKGKAKILYPSQQPPAFRSTESDRFTLDTMTGFHADPNKQGSTPKGALKKTGNYSQYSPIPEQYDGTLIMT